MQQCNHLYFIVICLFLSLSVVSQQTIDTIELSTTLIPMKAIETGRNVTVISAKDIDNTNFTSLDDLMQKFPGIEMQTRNRFGVQADITMRGSTFPQVLVLVDGMKINDPLTAHFNSYIPVSPGEIERIEILRGAASAMYGSEAVGGVINIITKRFGGHEEVRTNLSGEFDYGQNNLIATNNNLNIKSKTFFFNTGVNIATTDGEEIDSTRGNVLESYTNYFDIVTVGASTGVKLNNSISITARSAYDTRDFSARYFYTSSPFDKSIEQATNLFNQVQVKHIGTKNSTELKLAHRRGTDKFIFSNDFPSTNLHTTHFLNGQLNHLQSINEDVTVHAGLQFDKRQIESTDRGNHSDVHSAAFAMLQYNPKSKLNINLSARLDNDDNYGLVFTPQFNASLQQEKIIYRGSVGKTIRGADYTERYVSYNLENLTPGRSLGNPELDAEQAWSEEIGIDLLPSTNWKIKTTLFARQSNKLIDYVSTNAAEIKNNQNLQPGENYFYAQNITDVKTIGLELELWHNIFAQNGTSIDASLGYTFLNTSNDQDVISVYISNHAKHLVSANTNLSNGKFSVSISTLWKKRNERFAESINQTIKSVFNAWDFKFSYAPKDQVQIHLKAFNAFNQDNQDILGAVLPGRWLAMGFRYTI